MKRMQITICLFSSILLIVGCTNNVGDTPKISITDTPKISFIEDLKLSSKDYSEYKSITPKEEFVPTAEVAVKLANTILIELYGIDDIEEQSPFSVNLEDNIWILEGYLDENKLGGVAYIEIDKQTGQIRKVVHTK